MERYIQSKLVEKRKVDNTLILIHIETNGIYHLNEIGVALWSFFTEPNTIEDAKNIFITAFPEMPAKEISQDINKIIFDLIKLNLLHPVI